MKRILGLIAALMMVLASIHGAAAASADGTSPATAIALTSSQIGSVVGRTSGAFVYYAFPYPGDGSVGTLTLSFWPHDLSTANAVGVTLYQDGKQLATMNGVGNPPGIHALAFSSTTPGPVLVQVSNYAPGVAVSFQLEMSGVQTVPPAPMSTVAATKAPPGQRWLSGPVSGTLTGNRGGAYASFTIPYVGAGVAQSVRFSFWPNTGPIAPAVYVVAYQGSSRIGAVSGTQTDTPGSLTLWYVADTNGPVLIQVANYLPGTTITYALTP